MVHDFDYDPREFCQSNMHLVHEISKETAKWEVIDGVLVGELVKTNLQQGEAVITDQDEGFGGINAVEDMATFQIFVQDHGRHKDMNEIDI